LQNTTFTSLVTDEWTDRQRRINEHRVENINAFTHQFGLMKA